MVAGRNRCSGDIPGPDPPPPGRYRPLEPPEIFCIPGLRGDFRSGSTCSRQIRSPARSRCCKRRPQPPARFRLLRPLEISKIPGRQGDFRSGSACSRQIRSPARSRCCKRCPQPPGEFSPEGLRAPEASKSTKPPGILILNDLHCILRTFKYDST